MAADRIRALYVGGPRDGQVYVGKGYRLIPADIPVPLTNIRDADPTPGSWRYDRTEYRREALALTDKDTKVTCIANIYVCVDEEPPDRWDRARLEREWTRAQLAGCVEEGV